MHTIRILLLFFFCLALSSCAGTQGKNAFPPLPKAFLGWWEAGSSSIGCVGAHFHTDGRIEDICNINNQLIAVRHYKVIHIASPKDVHLAVYEPGKEFYLEAKRYPKSDTYACLHAWIQQDTITVEKKNIATGYENMKVEEQDCPLGPQEWSNSTATELWDFYQRQDNKEPFTSYSYARLQKSSPSW